MTKASGLSSRPIDFYALPGGSHLYEFDVEAILGAGGFGITYNSAWPPSFRRSAFPDDAPLLLQGDKMRCSSPSYGRDENNKFIFAHLEHLALDRRIAPSSSRFRKTITNGSGGDLLWRPPDSDVPFAD